MSTASQFRTRSNKGRLQHGVSYFCPEWSKFDRRIDIFLSFTQIQFSNLIYSDVVLARLTDVINRTAHQALV